MSPTYQPIQIFLLLCFIIILSIQPLLISGATFTISNNCNHTVWPGISSNGAGANLPTTGFSLLKGESRIINVSSSWVGRIWGRTHCAENSNGTFTCATGDCSSGNIECSGTNPKPPVTLAEFGNYGSGSNIYDISLVDGYNLPMLVIPPSRGFIQCTKISCVMDSDRVCPSLLKVPNGCMGPCAMFGEDQYCCTGEYNIPNTCKPTLYSKVFKKSCPQAYSYPYDDYTSTFVCAYSDYIITFCPEFNTSQTPAARRVPNVTQWVPNVTQWDAGMVYEGAIDNTSGSTPSTCMQLIGSSLIAGAVAVAASI